MRRESSLPGLVEIDVQTDWAPNAASAASSRHVNVAMAGEKILSKFGGRS